MPLFLRNYSLVEITYLLIRLNKNKFVWETQRMLIDIVEMNKRTHKHTRTHIHTTHTHTHIQT